MPSACSSHFASEKMRAQTRKHLLKACTGHRRRALLASVVVNTGPSGRRLEPGEDSLPGSPSPAEQAPPCPGAARVRGTHLTRPDLDVEVAPLVGDFEDLGPGEAVDPQPVPVDEEAVGADAQHDVDALRVLEEARGTGGDCSAAQ